MSSALSKRPHDPNTAESNGTAKQQKSTGHYTQDQPLKSTSHGTVFRVLCSASGLSRVTGENGIFISQISEKTGTEVTVEETIPSCKERIVVIKGSEKETEANAQTRRGEGHEEDRPNKAGGDMEEHDGNEGDKKSDNVVGSKSEMHVSSVQKALSLVFERIAEAEPQTNEVDTEKDKSSSFVLRLLVLSSQVGCLLGKGGCVIKQMSAESGAQILIVPRDKHPPCALASDEIVQITGQVDGVRKAFRSVIQLLLENPLHDRGPLSTNHMEPSSQSSTHTTHKLESRREPNHLFSSQRAPGVARPRDFTDFPSRMMLPPEMLTYRLVCSDERVGAVIGKGGAIIKTLQHDTGCEIKIFDGFCGSQDHVIVISGPAHPDDRISPAQDATLRVQARIARAIPDSKVKIVGARLLISSNQIGCLLGKGGSVITDMRKFTGAHIRVGNNQISKAASECDELVQISGEFEAVQEALLQITTRLRHHFFRDAFPSIRHPLDPAFPDMGPPFPPLMGRREFSPPGPYPNFRTAPHNSLGSPPLRDGFFPHDDRRPFMLDVRPGMPPHVFDRKPWGSQGFVEDGGPLGLADFSGDPVRRRPGFGGGTQPAIITNTTVEVVVPSSLVPVIYGEDGACLAQIRQISDAKVTITEAKAGVAAETVIIISGTPEQTFAAQSLIQAFVLSETNLPS